MNVERASKETREILRRTGKIIGAQRKHIYYMLNQIENSEEFSYGKRCRWLGWVHGYMCAVGVLTIDKAKAINRGPLRSVGN